MRVRLCFALNIAGAVRDNFWRTTNSHACVRCHAQEAEVAPVIADYWERAEFPLELVPKQVLSKL